MKNRGTFYRAFQYMWILFYIVADGVVKRISLYASDYFYQFTRKYRYRLVVLFHLNLYINPLYQNHNWIIQIVEAYCIVLLVNLVQIAGKAILTTIYAATIYNFNYDWEHFFTYIQFVLPWYLKNKLDPTDNGQIYWWISLLTDDEFILRCAKQHEVSRTKAIRNENDTEFSVVELSYYSGAILTQYLMFGQHVIDNEMDHHYLSAFGHIMDDFCDYEADKKDNKYNHFNNNSFEDFNYYMDKACNVFKKHKQIDYLKNYMLKQIQYPLYYHSPKLYHLLLQKFQHDASVDIDFYHCFNSKSN